MLAPIGINTRMLPGSVRFSTDGLAEGLLPAEMEFVCRHLGDRSRYGELDAMFRRGQERLTSGAAQRVADRERRVADAKRELASRRNIAPRPVRREDSRYSPAAVRERIAEVRGQSAHDDIYTWGTSCHEAGHAYAAVYFKLPLIEASIDTSAKPGYCVGGVCNFRNLDSSHASDVLVMAFAGAIAANKARHGEYAVSGMSGSDQDIGRRALDRACQLLPHLRKETVCETIVARAKHFVGTNWASIEKLARRLSTQKTMTAAEVQAVVGPCGPKPLTATGKRELEERRQQIAKSRKAHAA
jgi:hypothetical protein